MPYTIDIVKPLVDQLGKFATLNRHQLAGHVGNLDFWLGEVRHGLAVIDGYNQRFERLRAAQQQHVSEHGTTVFSPPDPRHTEASPSPPRRVPDGPMREARRSLCDAAYRFLVRCYREGLITESALREECRGLDIGVEASDLRAPQRTPSPHPSPRRGEGDRWNLR
jgi:hypothetical protein